MLLYIRALLFYLGMAAATLIMVPVSILVLPLPYHKRFGIVSNWARFNLWWLGVVCNLHADISGTEHIPDGPCIIMCKHQSAWETLAMQLVFPPQVWITKRELLWVPIYGWGLAAMQPIAINRGSVVRALKQLVREGTARLQHGSWVIVFPEGTRTRPGERRKYHAGGGLLAEKSGFPIIPVAHNAGYFWPRNSFTKQPGVINMIIGRPINVSDKKAEQIIAEVEQWIETTVADLPQPSDKP
ncbi:MAG: lysophospholipid acyltransferase family protein [Gammaproteobacteria bacterium]